MIFRLSQKLASKLEVTSLKILPVNHNPFADWSASLFSADRTQYMILTNTTALYSTVMYARGITDQRQFLDRTLCWLHEFMAADELGFIHERFVAPATNTVHFSKALNRSITGSMNDLIFQAKCFLTTGDLSPHDTSRRLNETPMSAIKYANPRVTLTSLAPK